MQKRYCGGKLSNIDWRYRSFPALSPGIDKPLPEYTMAEINNPQDWRDLQPGPFKRMPATPERPAAMRTAIADPAGPPA